MTLMMRRVPVDQIQQGDSALTAPRTPAKRLPSVDRSKAPPEMVQAAQGMEAMFLDHMMKQMRQSVPKSEMSLDNAATEIYQSMRDSEFAQTAAKSGGIGLADLIIANMLERSYNGTKEQVAPAQMNETRQPTRRSSTGGTNEGES